MARGMAYIVVTYLENEKIKFSLQKINYGTYLGTYLGTIDKTKTVRSIRGQVTF
jgi:expansin (peptidoglycan-binding protein)